MNQITHINAFGNPGNTTNSFTASPTRTEAYHEEITYDPNGNIKTYLRNGNGRSIGMDNLTDNYNGNSNQLNQVTDAATSATMGDYSDIKTQAANNYVYDKMGDSIKRTPRLSNRKLAHQVF